MTTRSTLALSALASLALCVAACGDTSGGTDTGDSAGDGSALATYRGGQVDIGEVEAELAVARSPACAAARQSLGGGSVDELIPCYQEIAESIALERLLLADVGSPEDAARELENYPQLRRQAFLETAISDWTREIEVSEAEIEAHFANHRESYRRPGSLELWTLFRRTEAGSDPAVTVQFLRDLKERFEAGETFAALAREHSQSETAQRGGQVGVVREGRLPKRLEQVAFSLADGDVSEPIEVSGGAILLHARNISRPFEPNLDQVHRRVEQDVRRQKLAERIEAIAATVEPPPSATVLDQDQLLEALATGELDHPVLDLQGDRITVAEARGFAGLDDGAEVADLDDEGREALSIWYRSRANRALVTHSLLESAEGDLRQRAEETLGQLAQEALVDHLLRSELAESQSLSEATLREYFSDNQHHYQSPPRFRLQQWTVPFGPRPPQQMRRMEAVRSQLVAETTTLSAASEQMGGTVRDLGWKTMSELSDLPKKALQLLALTPAGGFTVPYQQNEALHLLWVQEREEPTALDFEEAEERVRRDYLRRFEESLFVELADQRLQEAQFQFDSEALYRNLGQPRPAE